MREYRKEMLDQYHQDMKFWSNCVGELHHSGEELLEEGDLPKPLQRAYQDLWEDGLGPRCYLAEYHSLYGIALIQEYDEEFASICGMDMDTMYQSIRNKAAGLRNRIQLDGMALLTAESYGDHHELIVFMSAYERKERFLQAAALLNKEAYFLAAVTAKPPAAGQEEREENRN